MSQTGSSDVGGTGRDGVALALTEALRLSLEGRTSESLETLEELSRQMSQQDAAGRVALLLAAAHLAHHGGTAEQASRAEAELDAIVLACEDSSWPIVLHRARRDRRAGRLPSATLALREVVTRFRADAARMGPAACVLERLISREVARLERATRHPPAIEQAVTPAEPISRMGASELLELVERTESLFAAAPAVLVLRAALEGAVSLGGATHGLVALLRDDGIEWSHLEGYDDVSRQPALERVRDLVQACAGGSGEVVYARRGGTWHAALGLGRFRGGRAVIVVEGVDDLASERVEPARRAVLARWTARVRVALSQAEAARVHERAVRTAADVIRKHRSSAERRARVGDLVGVSDAMQDLFRQIDSVATRPVCVLITGETGTGKELVAAAIHRRGVRAEAPYEKVNCAALPETLLEAELFGHAAGAFTGADRPRAGLFERAHGGTLLLDEVGDMSPRMQAALLRVLQSGEVRRIGGVDTIHVDVRVIAATHRDLTALAVEGRFRLDLFYRINVLSIHVPPLRERIEDLPLLLAELLARHRIGSTPPAVAPEVLARLSAYAWPGNVRELENLAVRLAMLGKPRIEEQDLSAEFLCLSTSRSEATPVAPSNRPVLTLEQAEEDAIRRALAETAGQRIAAAKLLGIDRKTLYLKLKKLGLE